MTEGSVRRSFITCGVIFFVVFIGLYIIYGLAEPLMEHYFNWLATTVAAAAAWFDPAVSARDNLIFYEGTAALRVIEGCDGITVFILIAAAVLSFPKPFKQRLLGIAILIPVLFAINWLRLFILAEVRFYVPDWFQLFHVYLFQPFMIFATFACFIIWILRHEKTDVAH
ncbi:MAG: archaeosortase/exosortase family protein [Candidatus Competibacteraceae bacterium]|nr:archaeosortase/exosortase family protein [Candidatus Competibacteraceae bacterium]MCB1813379.1 archaeosortase/exosortase family protein [Candidatus Competibacteraceae bacterium]